MDRDKSIFINMICGRVLSAALEDGFRNQRSLEKLMKEFPVIRVLKWAATAHDEFFGVKETFGGLPVLNAQQTKSAPQHGPQPIQQEVISQAGVAPQAQGEPWAPNPYDHIKPSNLQNWGNWADKCPLIYKGTEMCNSIDPPKPWREVTYRDIMAHFRPDGKPGKPTYQSDWDALSYCMKSEKITNPHDPKYGKANMYRVAHLKAIMLALVAKYGYPENGAPQASQEAYVPSAQETYSGTDFPGETPF